MSVKDYKVQSRCQQGWNWMVAVYLFLGGVGSGAYVVGALAGFAGWDDLSNVGVVLSLPAIVVGMFFLLAHLGSPLRSYLTPARISTSWISRGVIFISFLMLFSLIHIIAIFAGIRGGAINIVAALGIICALGSMVYTGALLSASKGVPFWESGILPVLFMFSALVSGLATVLLVGYLGFSASISDAVSMKLAVSAVGLLVGEAVVLFFFLYAARQVPDSRDSAMALLRKSTFVFGDLILGLLVPLVLMLTVISMSGGGSTAGLMVVAAALALIGAYLLRYGILSVGMRTSFNISGFEFRVQVRPDPKTMMGRVPPGNVSPLR